MKQDSQEAALNTSDLEPVSSQSVTQEHGDCVKVAKDTSIEIIQTTIMKETSAYGQPHTEVRVEERIAGEWLEKCQVMETLMEDPDLWTKNQFSILMHQLVMQNEWLSDCRWNLRVTEVKVESYGETMPFHHHRRSHLEMRTEKLFPERDRLAQELSPDPPELKQPLWKMRHNGRHLT